MLMVSLVDVNKKFTVYPVYACIYMQGKYAKHIDPYIFIVQI